MADYHDDLLDQAEHLASLDSKKPKQANIRRAISTAYYALFDALSWEAAALLVAVKNHELRATMRRVFAHGDMRQVSEYFALRKGFAPILKPLVTLPIEPALQEVAEAFVGLQEQRHVADYNFNASMSRTDARFAIDLARRALTSWSGVRGSANANVFLLAFVLIRAKGH